MPNKRSQLLVCLIISAAVADRAPAQNGADPIARPAVVRVVGHADGLPRPGVLLHVPIPDGDVVKVDPQGCLIAEDQRVRRLRGSSIVRTDPNGIARLRTTPLWFRIRVGEPYFLWGNPMRKDNEWLVEVGQHEPVGVRVLDGDGEPLANFAVALHAAGKDMSVALTDAKGMAVLGVPRDFTARAVIAPAGWVGPKEGFPSIAESLEGRRGAVLKVPEYGSLRLRCTRGGVPVPTAVHGMPFFEPGTYAHISARPQVSGKAIGLVYQQVALGLELSSYSPFQGHGLIACAGPKAAGECKTVDVDLGPQFTMKLGDLDRRAMRNGVSVRLVTDAGEYKSFASRQRGGTFVVDFKRAIEGTRVVRVDVDAGEFSTSHACEHSLRTAAIDLGELKLAKLTPQLRGRVLDEQGAPVAGARVVISATGKRNNGYRLRTDAKGQFQTRVAVVRDAEGEAIQLFAMARHGELASEFVRGVDGEVTLTVRRPAAASKSRPTAHTGRLVVRFAGVKADDKHMFRLMSRFGRSSAKTVELLDDGQIEVTFESLRQGRYALLAPAPDYGTFVVVDGIEVPATGTCDDARLRHVDCGKLARFVTVHVVDEQSVPIAGARILGNEMVRTTDGTGSARLYIAPTVKWLATIEAAGKRSQRRDSLKDGDVIVLEPAGQVCVTVKGLPADMPRTNLEVWVRDEVRERLAGPRATLGELDTVTVPLPPRGRYVLQLLVSKSKPGGWRWSTMHVEPAAVTIGEDRVQEFEFRVDEKTVARIREALKKLN